MDTRPNDRHYATTQASPAGPAMPASDVPPSGSVQGMPNPVGFDQPPELPGIGPYHLLRVLGEGGFGVVYHAERREPFVQAVALKVLRAGMDTDAIVKRFELERQALALMDHPNVAKVLDGGITEPGSRLGPGRPYFVMELVRGRPIHEFCFQSNLDLKQRLELFMGVCEAVQHAHTKGIIHRDLKPSNIMVTQATGPAGTPAGKPIPKVIDFGIAKAVDHSPLEGATLTGHGQFVGTPEYMSPEQAGAVGTRGPGGMTDIDTRSDVYSLGVVLYQLLTGLLPFSGEQHDSLFETLRRIREVEPPRPSTRIESELRSRTSSIATNPARHTVTAPSGSLPPDEWKQLVRQLRGDLDWIVMRAIEKSRDRRYESPASLAADIRRYLRTEPVEAGPPSAGYRVGKFVRRNRLLVGAASLSLSAMVLGLGAAVYGLNEAREQATIAETRRKEAEASEKLAIRRQAAEQAASSVVERSVMAATHTRAIDDEGRMLPFSLRFTRALGREITVQEKIDPLARATVLRVIGETELAFGHPLAAEERFSRGLALLKELGSEFAMERLGLESRLARAWVKAGRSAEALAKSDELLASDPATFGKDTDLWIGDLQSLRGMALQSLGRNDEAIAAYRTAIDHLRIAIKTRDTASLAEPLARLAVLLAASPATRDEALALADEAFEVVEASPWEADSWMFFLRHSMGVVHRSIGEHAQAMDDFREALELAEVNESIPLPAVAEVHTLLAELLKTEGTLAEAEKAATRAIELYDGSAADPLELAEALDVAAAIAVGLGKFDQAAAHNTRQVELVRANASRKPDDLPRSLTGLADNLVRLGRFADAESAAAEALKWRQDSLPATDWRIYSTMSVLGAARAGAGDAPGGEKLLLDAVRGVERADRRPAGRLKAVCERVAEFYERTGQLESARTWRTKAAGAK